MELLHWPVSAKLPVGAACRALQRGLFISNDLFHCWVNAHGAGAYAFRKDCSGCYPLPSDEAKRPELRAARCRCLEPVVELLGLQDPTTMRYSVGGPWNRFIKDAGRIDGQHGEAMHDSPPGTSFRSLALRFPMGWSSASADAGGDGFAGPPIGLVDGHGRDDAVMAVPGARHPGSWAWWWLPSRSGRCRCGDPAEIAGPVRHQAVLPDQGLMGTACIIPPTSACGCLLVMKPGSKATCLFLCLAGRGLGERSSVGFGKLETW